MRWFDLALILVRVAVSVYAIWASVTIGRLRRELKTERWLNARLSTRIERLHTTMLEGRK